MWRTAKHFTMDRRETAITEPRFLAVLLEGGAEVETNPYGLPIYGDCACGAIISRLSTGGNGSGPWVYAHTKDVAKAVFPQKAVRHG